MLDELAVTEELAPHQQEETQDDPRVVSRADLFEEGGKGEGGSRGIEGTTNTARSFGQR